MKAISRCSCGPYDGMDQGFRRTNFTSTELHYIISTKPLKTYALYISVTFAAHGGPHVSASENSQHLTQILHYSIFLSLA